MLVADDRREIAGRNGQLRSQLFCFIKLWRYFLANGTLSHLLSLRRDHILRGAKFKPARSTVEEAAWFLNLDKIDHESIKPLIDLSLPQKFRIFEHRNCHWIYPEIDPPKRFGKPILIGTKLFTMTLSWLSEGHDHSGYHFLIFPDLMSSNKACLRHTRRDKEHL